MVKKGGSGGWVIAIVLIIILIAIGVYIFLNSQTRQAVCGTHTETYTSSAKGCDQIDNCQCIHESWGGLGACDSCQCEKEVSNC